MPILKVLLRIKRNIGYILNSFILYFGYQINTENSARLFSSNLRQSKKANMDVNDWQERVLGWEPALPILEKVVFPYLKEDSKVCEIGVGTGRWSRHILKQIPNGRLYLVDNSPWVEKFIKQYFFSDSRVRAYLCDSYSLPFDNQEFVDLVFSGGTFIAFKLGYFLLYGREFYRILKPGGYCIIEYIDVSSPNGWKHFIEHSSDYGVCYDYFSRETVEKVFIHIGFQIEKSIAIDRSTFVIAKKP